MNNICEKCSYANVAGKIQCKKCNINPKFENMFKPKNDYYPLELNEDHINLWNKNGKSKYTIALFKHNKHEDYWDLEFLGKRPLDDRVDRDKFFELVKLGYESLECIEDNE